MLIIDYVEISTTGNAVDFGDITTASGDKGTATISPTRFVYMLEFQILDIEINEYGTIASKGNAVTFGDLTNGASGFRMPIAQMVLEEYLQVDMMLHHQMLVNNCYITIATTGNATDFGDLTGTRQKNWLRWQIIFQTRGVICQWIWSHLCNYNRLFLMHLVEMHLILVILWCYKGR